ncbi:unnamed protein product, partial [Effrenium voratum]
VVLVDDKASVRLPWMPASCQIVINYDLPKTLSDYLRRLTALEGASNNPRFPRVVYSFVEEPQLKSRCVKDIVALLKTSKRYVDAAKKAEINSALGLIDDEEEEEEEWEEEDEDWDDDDWESCDCAHCRGSIIGSTSYHPLLPVPGLEHKSMSGIEVVRLPLNALEDFDKAVPFIAPRVSGHSCTLICLHCLNVHTPWDGWEQFFAPAELTGTMRVVLVLAEGVSWHDYPDCALLGAGGSAWIDILDMDSMDRSDMLLERLVDHEETLRRFAREMQFVAFLLLATVPASLGVSSGAKAKLAFIEERMHARMKTMTPETATLTNIEKSVLNMAQTKLSKTSANADAANLTAFLDQIQELLDNTMKKNILLRKEQTQADLDAGFGNLSSCLHPNDTSFNEDLKALSATHKTCRSEQDAVWKDYDATCILAKNIYLQNIKTLCDAYATAAVFPNPITTCSMDDAVQVPTIGNFLGDMEKFFEDEYESLKEKKDKCSLSRTLSAQVTPFTFPTKRTKMPSGTESSGSMMLKCLEVLLIGVTYIAVSAGLISFNKYLMKEHRFPHAVHLTAVHMATTMLLSTLLFTAAPSIYPSMAKVRENLGQLTKYMAPLGLLFSVALFCSNQAYFYSSVAFLQLLGLIQSGASDEVLLLNAGLAFVLNVLIAMTLKKLSALAFVLIGLLKDITIVASSAAVFGDPISQQQVMGFMVTIAGMGLWSHLKLQEQQKQQEPTEKTPLAPEVPEKTSTKQCDTARDTPFEHEELCKSKICSYYDHKISCDGKQKSLEEEACTLHKGHTCSGYSDCYTDKVEVYNGVVTLAKDGEAAVKAEWILVARIECLLNALKMEDAEVDAGITACKQKSYATDPVALTMHGDAPGARSCEEVFFQPGTATFSNIWYNGLPTATPAESCASQCCRADEFVPGYPSGAACPYVSDVTTTTPTTTTTTTKAATTTTKASFGFGGPATIASFGGFGGFPR